MHIIELRIFFTTLAGGDSGSGAPSISSDSRLSRDNLQNFRQQQFNAVIENAARVKGATLNVKINFPEGS